MEHSEMFENIREWYQVYHLWKKEHVHAAVPGLITAEEYEEIVGEPYVPGEPDETKEKAEAFDILMGEDDE